MPDGTNTDTRQEAAFEAIGRQARMDLAPKRFPTAERRDAVFEGWAIILGRLERIVNARPPSDALLESPTFSVVFPTTVNREIKRRGAPPEPAVGARFW